MNSHPLEPDAARAIIAGRVGPLLAETIPHERALGRVLASDVVASLDLPPFANSAMDGYAARATDLATAPQTLALLETIGAGEVAKRIVEPGTCIKIMTGAPLPDGADCVVMREETREESGRVEFHEAARAGQNVRSIGEDVRMGETVFRAGAVVNAAAHALLASLGCARVEVFRRPRVAIVVTGAELVATDAPLEAGQIRDSNSWALRALVGECGAHVAGFHRTGDGAEEVAATVRAAMADADVLISSGGVSAGDFDPMRDLLLQGAEVHFWKVNIRPGKPLLFASFGGVPVFALPGNPASVMVTFEEFVRPALLHMAGVRAWRRLEVEATLESAVRSPLGRTEFVRVGLHQSADGLLAAATGNQGSGRLSTMARADALLEIGPETASLPAGARVRVKLLSGAGVSAL